MKQVTPIQELIYTFEEMRNVSPDSTIDLDFAISLTKSMLEREKEAMCEFADDYQQNCFQKSPIKHFNETFNTENE